MDTRQLLTRGATIVIDPQQIRMTPDEYLAAYGSYMDTVCLVAKSQAGTTYYPSNSAPRDEDYGQFFSSFAQIATDIGIKVYAMFHSTHDKYFSKNPNFQLVNNGGEPVPGWVCPSRENYWLYLAELCAEVAEFPIEGIILTDLAYPRETTCFCESCRRVFSQRNNMDRDFSLERLQRNDTLFHKWLTFRTNSVNKLISTVVNRVHQIKKIDVLPELLLDLQTGLLEGSLRHFGQDYNSIRQVTSHILIHLFPWSPFPSTEEEINMLSETLGEFAEHTETTKTSLYIWDITDTKFNFAQSIKTNLNSKEIFVLEEEPIDFLDRRSLYLGLGV